MTDDGRPGSRSERHQRGRAKGRRAEDASSPRTVPSGPPFVPVIEPLRPPPARSERRADQRADKRRRRTRASLALIVVGALIAGGLGWAIYQRQKTKPPVANVIPARSQRTVLLQVPAPSGDALAAALLVTDTTSTDGVVLLVPSRMLSQVPGFGAAPFGEALKLGGDQGPLLSQDALANQLGVIIDESWAVSAAALAGLVDAVGGVDVLVDVDLPGGEASSNITLRQGQQVLPGPEAAAFATYGVPGQPELGRLTRFQQVLRGVLDKLVATPLQSTAIPRPVADSLNQLAKAQAAQQLSYKVLPVTDIDNGSDLETTRLDPAQLAPVLEVLAASVPANEFRPNNRVVIFNGAGNPAVGQSVTRRLNAAGFRVEKTGNADNFNYERSQILIFDSGDRAVAAGEAVASALGLSADQVEMSVEEQDVADVFVTVGSDYAAGPPAGSVSPSVGP